MDHIETTQRRESGFAEAQPASVIDKDYVFTLLPFLRDLPPPLGRELRERGSLRQVRAGANVSDVNSRSDRYLLLMSGSIEVDLISKSGREFPLHRLVAGEGCNMDFGNLLQGVRYPVRCVAAGDASLLEIPSELFQRLFDEFGPFRQHVCEQLSRRVRGLADTVEQLAFHTLDERLSRLLGKRAPILHVTHEALARELGCVREVVTRYLNVLAREGLVKLGRGKIEVRDPARLLKRAGNNNHPRSP
jgi:CRP/FNR family transcriptional regulator, anaerobic regulatory protein